ncbi:MAG: rod shape-determining protein [Clostridium sp.]|nr:rod shape-determining protein [Clostridium sp.]
MFDMDIGIDLGTANVLVFVKGKGIVINQPSVVAFETKSKRLVAIGNKAKLMMGKEPDNIEVIRPLRQGVISDYTVTERMLKTFIETAMQKKRMLSRPRICVCVPSGVTELEKRGVEDAVYRSGAKHVDIMEEPIAAAIGADIDISLPKGNMIVDIGGGTTDVAVISLGGIVVSNSLKLAGDDYNEAMIKYIRRTYNLLIGEPTAEKIKMNIGSVYPREEPLTMEVKGRDMVSGYPARIIVSSEETIEAFAEVTAQILDTIHNVLEISPPELIADIAEKGIVLTGGGSLLYGMDRLVEESTGIQAFVSQSALEAVVVGAGKSARFVKK